MASLYEQKFMYMDLYNHTYDAVLAMLPVREPRVLEVGCGPGNITRYLLEKRHDCKILGTDIAPNMLELAQKHNPTATFLQMDCRDIRKLEPDFDAIISGFCLPYLTPEEADRFIADSSVLLKPEGILYLSFVEGTVEQSGFKTGSGGNRVYFNYHQWSDVEQALHTQGFSIFERFSIPYPGQYNTTDYHTVLIAKKDHRKE